MLTRLGVGRDGAVTSADDLDEALVAAVKSLSREAFLLFVNRLTAYHATADIDGAAELLNSLYLTDRLRRNDRYNLLITEMVASRAGAPTDHSVDISVFVAQHRSSEPPDSR